MVWVRSLGVDNVINYRCTAFGSNCACALIIERVRFKCRHSNVITERLLGEGTRKKQSLRAAIEQSCLMTRGQMQKTKVPNLGCAMKTFSRTVILSHFYPPLSTCKKKLQTIYYRHTRESVTKPENAMDKEKQNYPMGTDTRGCTLTANETGRYLWQPCY